MTIKVTMAVVWTALTEEQKQMICTLLTNYTDRKYVHLGSLALMRVDEVIDGLMECFHYQYHTTGTAMYVPSVGNSILGTVHNPQYPHGGWATGTITNADRPTVAAVLAAVAKALSARLEIIDEVPEEDYDARQANYG